MWHNTYVWKRHALHIQYNVSYKSTSLTLKSNVFKGLAFMQHDMLKCFLQYAQYCCTMQKCTYGKYVQKSSDFTIFRYILIIYTWHQFHISSNNEKFQEYQVNEEQRRYPKLLGCVFSNIGIGSKYTWNMNLGYKVRL